MSRKEKFSRAARSYRQQEADDRIYLDRENEETELPARSKKHPSSKNKLSRLYYNVLFILFVALVIFLFWYGNKYYSTS
ncbi:hypothetical protein [Paenibacillus endoradicis]|uniref:hypothetical protein n=1 Tax=Paenibacillus endoradicis TaxID=2972487 RepID=UPI002158D2A0|nr:hypothetical protein [Paenibacillus endoradicis]MCR8660326.1 hypothetical protein [Paenibacillus endoradicis]